MFGFISYFSNVKSGKRLIKLILIRAIPVLLVLLLAVGCNKTERTLEKVSLALDSIKEIHAPDTRVSVWDIQISEDRGAISLEGEVENMEAFDAVTGMVELLAPGIELELKLLPEEDPGRPVNGVVGNSVINMRSAPAHRAELVTQALMGTPVRILKEQEGWYLIQVPNRYLGWVERSVVQPLDEAGLARYRTAHKVVFNEQYGFSYSEPDTGSRPVTDLVAGCILPVISETGDFYQVTCPDSAVAWVVRDQVRNAMELFSMELSGEKLVKTALKYHGIPYLWGGTSPKAVDCSGLSHMIYYMNGMLLARDASQQCLYGRVVTTLYSGDGLLPGDLLFYGRRATADAPERVSHVGIYLGDSRFIHASENLGKVWISSMDSTSTAYIPEYRDLFVRAVRITGEVDRGFQPITENEFYKEIINTRE